MEKLRFSFVFGFLHFCKSFPFRAGLDNLFSRLSRVRRTLDEIQLDEPLRRSDPPQIELLLVVAGKDFRSVEATIEGALRASINPVGNVKLIVPEAEVDRSRRMFPSFEILSEDTVLPDDLMASLRKHHPPGRFSWVFQQLLSLVAARSSSFPSVLQLDADTVLLKRRQFVDSKGNQLLFVSEEAHPPYEIHARKIWGERKRFRGFSFVTHHQLWQVDILERMFPCPSSLIEWVKAADLSEDSPVAHYHCYGRWIVDHEFRRVRVGRWRNESVAWGEIAADSPDSVLELASRKFPLANSVSCHTFLDVRTSSG